MPFGSEPREPGIGLALSGGGFRATLFHLGTLWRLNELGWVARLDRISSVSGGSITSGLLAVQWERLKARDFAMIAFDDLVVKPLRSFCARNIDAPAIGEGAFLPWKTISEAVEDQYREHLLGDVRLSDLPDPPRFVFNATNFGTGVSFRFSKPYAGDYRIGLIRNPAFRVSLAVTASSAFPPVLSPVVVHTQPSQYERTDGADLFDNPAFHGRLVLTDGGVYDNLGLETVWNRYDTVLVSDAGAPLDVTEDVETSWHKQAMRALDVTTSQARALRKRALVADFLARERTGSYWGIATKIAKYELPDALPCAPQRAQALAQIRTRLNRFSEQEQCELINWGYALCDAAMRKHVLSPPDAQAAAPRAWPYPQYALDRA
ncbi:MAG: patatin-like phospholipase family protein [Acidobacteria bacterium]|nr:patatin-like phospholipase family protein [Acidobacteriota bacterium]